MDNLVDKSGSVKRKVDVYGVESKERLKEIRIDIPIEELRKLVSPKEGDTMLHLGYTLNIKQVFTLNNYFAQKISPDFTKYTYYLVCEDARTRE